MKFICSAVVVLLACQLALGNVVPRNDFEDENKECANELFNRLRVNIEDQATEIYSRMESLQTIYYDCQNLPYAQRDECLRGFSQYFITAAEEGVANLTARQDAFSLYALDRLVDYYACRVTQESPVAQPLDSREVLCTVRFVNNALDYFGARFEPFLNAWYRLNYHYVQCYISPATQQPRCFMDLTYEARTELSNILVYLSANHDSLFESTDHLLNIYYQCRINFTPLLA